MTDLVKDRCSIALLPRTLPLQRMKVSQSEEGTSFLYVTLSFTPCGDHRLRLRCIEEIPWALYIEDITRWREDMNFMFEWQEQVSEILFLPREHKIQVRSTV